MNYQVIARKWRPGLVNIGEKKATARGIKPWPSSFMFYER
jgi:hypothetical protein